jgi:uncharacterized protein YggE
MSVLRSLTAHTAGRTAVISGVALVAVIAAAPLTGWHAGGQANAAVVNDPTGPTRGITVQGTGKITIRPDLATISVGIQSQAGSARAAQSQASAAMTKIIAAVKGLGIDDADIASQWVSLQPQYDYNNGGSVPPRVVGYQASQTLTVKVRDIEKSGDVIDEAVAAGATQVSGMSFSVSDPTAASAQARTAAIADAKARADALAKAAGVSLGGAISITETSTPISIPYPYMEKGAAGAADVRTPVQPGTTDVEVDVQVTFAIG